MKLMLVKGATSVQVAIFVRDSSQTDGRGLTGLVYNTGGLVAYYWRPGGTPTAITLQVLAAWRSAAIVGASGR